ncbi:MAG: U32 family peptidase [Clostridiales bacterium]|nr:U32 family peptidase [Clostridiales bacterium]
MKDKIELLAPAGDVESFYAAVKNGADAVYLGGKLFNARMSADNFSIDDIRHLVVYAHIRGVKVYITVNTLVSDEEFEDAIDFLSQLYLANVDGVIIQDLGLACIARQMFQELSLHASTQMTIYNKYGVEFLKRIGFSRVVLARETSLIEIRDVVENCDVDIEVFGHGALCISYSGQCLLSSMIGSRSGNRGRCAQPCRLKYELLQNDRVVSKGHLISPKDLCSIDRMNELIDSKVKSIKIEGRMKTPEYVATVIRIYRKYIDNKRYNVEKQDFKDLMQIFNRGGFTKGYFDGGAPNNMITTDKPKNLGVFLGKVVFFDVNKRLVTVKLKDSIEIGDGIEICNGEEKNPGVIVSQILLNNEMVKNAKSEDIVKLGYLDGNIKKNNLLYKTSSKRLNKLAKASICGKDLKRIALRGSIIIMDGKPLELVIEDKDKNVVKKISDVYPCKAINKPLVCDRVIEQLKKTGDTPYYFETVDVKLEDGVVVPISEINNIRRLAIEELDSIRGEIKDKKIATLGRANYEMDTSHPLEISLFFYNVDYDMKYWELGASRIYLPVCIIEDERYKKLIDMCRKNNVSVYVHIPAVTRKWYDEYIERKLDKLKEFAGVMCGNVGTVKYLEDKIENILCDYTLNIFNTHAIELLKRMKTKEVTLSCELTLNQINALKKVENVEKEVIVYGSLPVMTMEYCIVGDLCGRYKDGKCNEVCRKDTYYLKDRKGEKFRIMCDPHAHRCILFNSNKIFMGKDIEKMSGVNRVRLNILDENFDEIKELVDFNIKILRGSSCEGLIKQDKYTKGHLYRKV